MLAGISDKCAKWAMITLIILCVGIPIFYYMVYFLLDVTDETIVYRYASQNQFSENIYFSVEAEKTGVFSDWINNIDGMKEVSSECLVTNTNYQMRVFMGEKVDEFVTIAEKNDKYVNYLNSMDTSIDELKKYIIQMAKLDDNIIIEDYELRCRNVEQKGEAHKRWKSFKIDNAKIPFLKRIDVEKKDEYGNVISSNDEQFLCYVLECYFSHKDLLKEYFQNIIENGH